MKRIIPLHSRANVLPRPDIHARLHGLMVDGGVIDSELFGRVRVENPIHYQTPAPRDSFAFGEIAAMGLPSKRESYGSEELGLLAGDIVGFDLHQTGHEIGAAPYYERSDTFYTLPWKELLCRFGAGCDLPQPIGWWVMVMPDSIMTRRLVFSAGSDCGLVLPGSTSGSGVATNKGKKTRVRLAAGRVLAFGHLASEAARGAVDLGCWALYNPLDAVTILYTRDPADTSSGPAKRTLAFVRWDDIEQAVEDAPAPTDGQR